MRLINTKTFKLETVKDYKSTEYAILSHTWGDQELTFADKRLQEDTHSVKSIPMKGYYKVMATNDRAQKRNYPYIWVDTCCINKADAVENATDINSMYEYYANAAVCFILLEDVGGSGDALLNSLRNCRWATRGWTLQELVACRKRVFFDRNWNPIEATPEFMRVLSDITGISEKILNDSNLVKECPIAQRMKWASTRKVTFPEDMTYCLLGLFDISMPVIYGEGFDKAFKRLQREIIQQTSDQSIFAWRADRESSGLLATSPKDFSRSSHIEILETDVLSSFQMTNLGLQIKCNMSDADGNFCATIHCFEASGNSQEVLKIYLRVVAKTDLKVDGKPCKAYRRIKCDVWGSQEFSSTSVSGDDSESIIVMEDEHYKLIKRVPNSSLRLGGVDSEDYLPLVSIKHGVVSDE